jgi:hypothetical protein
MNAILLREIGKLGVEERRALIDDLQDSIEAEQVPPPLDARLKDSIERPHERTYTLWEIAARHGIEP